jgi:hypothetical protein
MTSAQLADYLINADLELQIIRKDYATLAEAVLSEWPTMVLPTPLIEEAVNLALEDPYIQLIESNQ